MYIMVAIEKGIEGEINKLPSPPKEKEHHMIPKWTHYLG